MIILEVRVVLIFFTLLEIQGFAQNITFEILQLWTPYITRPTTERFPNCTACCKSVLGEFPKSGFDLLLETAKDCKYLENLAGLTHLMSETNFEDIIACSDDDDF